MSEVQFKSIDEVYQYLFKALPMFQRDGAIAYNKNLGKTIELLKELGDPQKKFRSVHIGGTNGKGSSAHMIASIFQSSGYKTGLYTSPHLKRFNERIRIDGREVPNTYVLDFVNEHISLIERLAPSFFEITVAMAFDYFCRQKVDVAIIEVGMGGKLDSTNVIDPLLSLITNIGLDHTQFLGTTRKEIAEEKAGIIKRGRPVVVGTHHPETDEVFEKTAQRQSSPLYYPDEYLLSRKDDFWEVNVAGKTTILKTDLKGDYIGLNIPGVLKSIELLAPEFPGISPRSISEGLINTCSLTDLKGRWQRIREHPTVVVDTGHNEDGIKIILNQIKREKTGQLWMIWGCVSDKEIEPILKLLPKDADYTFATPNIPRGLRASELEKVAQVNGIQGRVIDDVNEALNYVLEMAAREDFIFIGGSTFLVAELNEL